MTHQTSWPGSRRGIDTALYSILANQFFRERQCYAQHVYTAVTWYMTACSLEPVVEF